MQQLSLKVVTVTTGLFGAVMFVACVVYGLLVPALHNAALLEAVLPGFHWLTPGSLLLGVVETLLYGAFAGLVFACLYNAVSRRLGADRILTVILAGAAIVAVAASGAAQTPAPPHRDITVQDLFTLNHCLEVDGGTVVVWKDPHFERIWFPSAGRERDVEEIVESFDHLPRLIEVRAETRAVLEGGRASQHTPAGKEDHIIGPRSNGGPAGVGASVVPHGAGPSDRDRAPQ